MSVQKYQYYVKNQELRESFLHSNFAENELILQCLFSTPRRQQTPFVTIWLPEGPAFSGLISNYFTDI